jgi:alpha-tubulin suppressor-like RCC1 family protein
MPRTTPDTPVLSVVSSTPVSADLSWTAPFGNGASITSYQLYINSSLITSKTGRTHTITNLTPGVSYAFKVRACNIAGCGSFGEVSLTTLPKAPGVKLTRGDANVSVSWTLPTGSLARTDLFYRASGSDTWIEWTSDLADTSPVLVSGLTNGVVYEFKVKASNITGEAESTPMVAMPVGIPTVAPGTLSLTATETNSLTVSWNTPQNTGGSGILSFNIYKDAGLIATVSGSLRTYTLTGLLPGKTNSYQLNFCTIAGCSPISTAINLSTRITAPEIIEVVSTDTEVIISWKPSIGDTLKGYKIYYKTDEATTWNELTIDDIEINLQSLGDLSNGYWTYRLAGIDDFGDKMLGSLRTERAAPEYAPAEPEFLQATPTNGSVLLEWETPSNKGRPSLNGYVIRYGPSDGGEWNELVLGDVRSYSIGQLTNGVSYDFKVYSKNSIGLSPGAPTGPIIPRTTPSSPSPLSLDHYGAGDKLALIWNIPTSDGGSLITGYLVEYATGTGAFSTLALAGASDTMFIANDLVVGTEYRFKVTPYNIAGAGVSSNIAIGTPITTPGVPHSLYAGGLSPYSVGLSWKEPLSTGGTSISEYEVSYKETTSSTWSYLTVDGNTTFVAILGLTPETNYEFYVNAKNPAGVGPTSDAVYFTTFSQISISYLQEPFDPSQNSQVLNPLVYNGPAQGYNLNGTLPEGVSFDSNTGIFTGPYSWKFQAAQLALGGWNSCVLTWQHQVRCWGESGGMNGTNSRVSPGGANLVSGLGPVYRLAAGGSTACAILGDDTIKCWGGNSWGVQGNGSQVSTSQPVLLENISKATDVDLGMDHGCAIVANGGVKCWGMNNEGQFGNGSLSGDVVGATSVSGMVGAVKLAVGREFTCVLKNDKKVSCWGNNGSGQLGLGYISYRSTTPVAVPGLSDIEDISAGGAHVCVKNSSKQVYCWGQNLSGQIGQGTFTDHIHTPTLVPLEGEVSKVVAGSFHTCALMTSGSVKCWGSNSYGQLGNNVDGAAPNAGPALAEPTLVSNIVDAIDIDSDGTSGFHNCITRESGAVECWGANGANQTTGSGGAVASTPQAIPTSGPKPYFNTTVTVSTTGPNQEIGTTTVDLKTKSCSEGGICEVGDIGPGGGIVYYVSRLPFKAPGAACDPFCNYLEVSPTNWQTHPSINSTEIYMSSSEPARDWGASVNIVGANGFEIGDGYWNSYLIDAGVGNTEDWSAAALARSYTGGGKQDWFLPSVKELNELCKYARQQTTGDTKVPCTSSGSLRAGFASGSFSLYKSSTEKSSIHSYSQFFANQPGLVIEEDYKTNEARVRPIRVF